MKRKIFLVVLAVMILLTGTAFAKPYYRADTTYYDINTGLYVLKGNCYLEVANRVITCNEAKVSVGSLEVWGYGSLRLTQGDITFTGDSAYIYGLKHCAKIDGGISFSRTGLKITADSAEYNWQTKTGVFSGHVRINQNGREWTADTLNYNVETNTIL